MKGAIPRRSLLMLALSSPIPSPDRSRIFGSIRKAQQQDTPELARLFAASQVEPGVIESALAADDRGHLLVLDLDGALCAVEYVVIEQPSARLQLLIMDAALGAANRGEIEARMIGVALALCEAYSTAMLPLWQGY